LVERIQSESAGKAPRLVTGYKFYEQHPDYKGKIDEAYKQRYGEGSKSWSLSKHVALAKELFEAEDEETKAKVEEEAKTSHIELLEAYNNAKAEDFYDTGDPEAVDSYVFLRILATVMC
jgi:hypothetical protein